MRLGVAAQALLLAGDGGEQHAPAEALAVATAGQAGQVAT
jgi:hypothetical protein